jgi:hypothetical protein
MNRLNDGRDVTAYIGINRFTIIDTRSGMLTGRYLRKFVSPEVMNL